MSEQERRRHQRYPLRLPITVKWCGRPLNADIVNASASGCLLAMAHTFEPGDALIVSIPELNMPRGRLIVVRSEASDLGGYLVATRFDELADESTISQMSSDQQEDPKKTP